MREHHRWGFIDRAGNLVVPCIYEDVADFKEGLAAVVVRKIDRAKHIGFIDKVGQVSIEPQFADVIGGFAEGLAAVAITDPVSKELKYGFIDKSGSWRIQPRFDDVRAFNENAAAVCIIDRSKFPHPPVRTFEVPKRFHFRNLQISIADERRPLLCSPAPFVVEGGAK